MAQETGKGILHVCIMHMRVSMQVSSKFNYPVDELKKSQKKFWITNHSLYGLVGFVCNLLQCR